VTYLNYVKPPPFFRLSPATAPLVRVPPALGFIFALYGA